MTFQSLGNTGHLDWRGPSPVAMRSDPRLGWFTSLGLPPTSCPGLVGEGPSLALQTPPTRHPLTRMFQMIHKRALGHGMTALQEAQDPLLPNSLQGGTPRLKVSLNPRSVLFPVGTSLVAVALGSYLPARTLMASLAVYEAGSPGRTRQSITSYRQRDWVRSNPTGLRTRPFPGRVLLEER